MTSTSDTVFGLLYAFYCLLLALFLIGTLYSPYSLLVFLGIFLIFSWIAGVIIEIRMCYDWAVFKPGGIGKTYRDMNLYSRNKTRMHDWLMFWNIALSIFVVLAFFWGYPQLVVFFVIYPLIPGVCVKHSMYHTIKECRYGAQDVWWLVTDKGSAYPLWWLLCKSAILLWIFFVADFTALEQARSTE